MLKRLALPDNDSERLEKLLKSITEEGGVVKIFEEDGDIQALTVTSNEINAIRGTEPFNVEENGYKLSACLYLDPLIKKGEICNFSYLLMRLKNLTRIKNLCVGDPSVIIIDKVRYLIYPTFIKINYICFPQCR